LDSQGDIEQLFFLFIIYSQQALYCRNRFVLNLIVAIILKKYSRGLCCKVNYSWPSKFWTLRLKKFCLEDKILHNELLNY